MHYHGFDQTKIIMENLKKYSKQCPQNTQNEPLIGNEKKSCSSQLQRLTSQESTQNVLSKIKYATLEKMNYWHSASPCFFLWRKIECTRRYTNLDNIWSRFTCDMKFINGMAMKTKSIFKIKSMCQYTFHANSEK